MHDIRRLIAGSVRSHYGRKELQALFELQPRAAQKLLEMLPSVSIGTSRLVETAALSAFLERVQQAENVSDTFEQVRQEKVATSQRRLLSLVTRDAAPVSLDSLPDGMRLSRGRLEVSFHTTEALARAMYFLARVLESEGEQFMRDYDPQMNSASPPVLEPELSTA